MQVKCNPMQSAIHCLLSLVGEVLELAEHMGICDLCRPLGSPRLLLLRGRCSETAARSTCGFQASSLKLCSQLIRIGRYLDVVPSNLEVGLDGAIEGRIVLPQCLQCLSAVTKHKQLVLVFHVLNGVTTVRPTVLDVVNLDANRIGLLLQVGFELIRVGDVLDDGKILVGAESVKSSRIVTDLCCSGLKSSLKGLDDMLVGVLERQIVDDGFETDILATLALEIVGSELDLADQLYTLVAGRLICRSIQYAVGISLALHADRTVGCIRWSWRWGRGCQVNGVGDCGRHVDGKVLRARPLPTLFLCVTFQKHSQRRLELQVAALRVHRSSHQVWRDW
jgi:hypothetical protein